MTTEQGLLNCISDYEREARRNLPKSYYDYYSSGSGVEQDNESAYRRYRLKPRMMKDVSNRKLSTTILGEKVAFPIAISPVGLQCLAHHEGETATAKAASALNTGMALSTWATRGIEEVTQAAPDGLKWLQIEAIKDKELLKKMIQRAELVGFKALIVTVDRPIGTNSHFNQFGKFSLPSQYSFGNFRGLIDVQSPRCLKFSASEKTSYNTWKFIEWLTSVTSLPVVIKGILRGEDAIEAVRHGVSGILVSNHGGRVLDSVTDTINALPEIVDAVKHTDVEIYVDGGVRRGTDVLTALALGARAVFVGRPIIWGLAYDGELGVKRVLEILRDEFDVAMALTGCRCLSDITPDLLEKTCACIAKL